MNAALSAAFSSKNSHIISMCWSVCVPIMRPVQTEMTATAIVARARWVTLLQLTEVHGLDSHHIGHLIDDDLAIAASELVRPVNTASLPVTPVEIITYQTQTEWMRQIIGDNLASIAAIHIGHFDLVGFGIAPVELHTFEIQSNIVWPDDVLSDQQLAFAPIKIAALDLRPFLIPIGPEHPAELMRDRDSPRFNQIFIYHHPPISTIQSRHFDPIRPGVGPEHIARDPIDRDAIRICNLQK